MRKDPIEALSDPDVRPGRYVAVQSQGTSIVGTHARRPSHSRRRDTILSAVFGQNLEEPDALQKLAHPCSRMYDPQYAMCRDGHVVRSDQFANPARIDSWHAREVQYDVTFTATD